MIEEYKKLNDINEIYSFDTPCNVDITYQNGSKYEQEHFYYDNENLNFSYEYDLLPTDLTLILDFDYQENGMYLVKFSDIHQL